MYSSFFIFYPHLFGWNTYFAYLCKVLTGFYEENFTITNGFAGGFVSFCGGV